MSAMPVLLAWDIVHSIWDCDAFELSFPIVDGLAETLTAASELLCTHEGETVFRGVVDEYELSADASGATARLSGRGRAAYLLDNEAESAEYWDPGIDLILERHVYPWRISEVSCNAMSCRGRFPISSGSSQWKVLRDFCFFGGGVEPRFDRRGRLILTGERGDEIDLGSAAVVRQREIRRRSGVFSHVLVKNNPAGISTVVENPEAIELGCLCRRVVNVPRYTLYDSMRYTGEYQIAQSEREMDVTELTLPLMFPAFAGDIVLIASTPLGAGGRYLVAESRCTADAGSGETVLRLIKEE